MKELLTVKEAAPILKIHPQHIYRLVYQKRIPYIKKPGLGIRFDPDEIEKWIEEGKVQTQNCN